jgi:hypothetical protein
MSFGGDLSVRFVAPWSTASSLGLALIYVRNDLFAAEPEAAVGSMLFELTGCPKRFGQRDVFTFEPCLTATGGWMHAADHTLQTSTEVTRSYFALGGLLIGAVPLGPHWTAEFQGGFGVPLVKRHFTVSEPPREVAETPAISGIAGFGITYSF